MELWGADGWESRRYPTVNPNLMGGGLGAYFGAKTNFRNVPGNEKHWNSRVRRITPTKKSHRQGQVRGPDKTTNETKMICDRNPKCERTQTASCSTGLSGKLVSLFFVLHRTCKNYCNKTLCTNSFATGIRNASEQQPRVARQACRAIFAVYYVVL